MSIIALFLLLIIKLLIESFGLHGYRKLLTPHSLSISVLHKLTTFKLTNLLFVGKIGRSGQSVVGTLQHVATHEQQTAT